MRPLPSIHANLYEIRVKDRRGAFRVVYYIKKGNAIIVIHAFRKKTQKMSAKEKKVILSRLKEIGLWSSLTLIKM